MVMTQAQAKRRGERWFLYKGMTTTQRRYIWLMGSHPDKQMFQGRGKRSRKLLYAITDDELYIFWYSNPPYFAMERWFEKGQAPNSYNLREAGQLAFQWLLANGGVPSDEFEETRLKP